MNPAIHVAQFAAAGGAAHRNQHAETQQPKCDVDCKICTIGGIGFALLISLLITYIQFKGK